MGFNGRFWSRSAALGWFRLPFLPPVSDASGSDGGSRFASCSMGRRCLRWGRFPGESEIWRYVLENDLVEVIIGLPTDMFYNTGISTFVWIVRGNRKARGAQGFKLRSSDASSFWRKMRRARQQTQGTRPEHIGDITAYSGRFGEIRDGAPITNSSSGTRDFGYRNHHCRDGPSRRRGR